MGPAPGTSPAMLAVLTMWPSPCAVSTGRKARIPWMTPHRLTPSTHFHAESGPNHGSARLATPALLQPACTAPKRSTAAAARILTAASSLTSVGTASVLPPKPAIFSEAACSAGYSACGLTTSSPARGDPHRQRKADTAGGPGDDGNFSRGQLHDPSPLSDLVLRYTGWLAL